MTEEKKEKQETAESEFEMRLQNLESRITQLEKASIKGSGLKRTECKLQTSNIEV